MFNWLQLKLNETLILNNCSCLVSHQNTIIIAYQLSTTTTILITFRDKRELETHKITVVISNKQLFLIVTVTASHMAHLSIWL